MSLLNDILLLVLYMFFLTVDIGNAIKSFKNSRYYICALNVACSILMVAGLFNLITR